MEKYLSYIAKFKKQLHMYRMTQLLYKGYVCAHVHVYVFFPRYAHTHSTCY